MKSQNIYVLGHSFAKADLDYFAFLHAVTQCGCDYEAIAPAGHLDEGLLMAISSDEDIGEEILMNMIMANIEYAIHHRNRLNDHAKGFFPEMKEVDAWFGGQKPYQKDEAEYAVKQRFWFEQSQRTQSILEKLASEYCVSVPRGCHSILGYMDYVDDGHDQRRRNAQWHISYHSKDDQKRIEKAMRELHNKRYILYDTIDKCIEGFMK